MPTRLVIHFEGVGDAMRDPGVRQALRAEATALADRARGLYAAEGMNATVRTETGTNGAGRPFARVLSDAADAEFGTSKTERRRVLGRAAEQRS